MCAIKESSGYDLVSSVGMMDAVETQMVCSHDMVDVGQVDKLVTNCTTLPTLHLLVEVVFIAIAAGCLQRLCHIVFQWRLKNVSVDVVEGKCGIFVSQFDDLVCKNLVVCWQ